MIKDIKAELGISDAIVTEVEEPIDENDEDVDVLGLDKVNEYINEDMMKSQTKFTSHLLNK